MPADLMPFGFTATESMVYSTLLRLGPATGYAVARAVRLARANAYGALDGLVSRGAAVRMPGRPTRYRPADPQALLAQIAAAHGEALDRLSRALADAGRSTEPDTKTLAGARAVANVVLQLVARAERRGPGGRPPQRWRPPPPAGVAARGRSGPSRAPDRRRSSHRGARARDGHDAPGSSHRARHRRDPGARRRRLGRRARGGVDLAPRDRGARPRRPWRHAVRRIPFALLALALACRAAPLPEGARYPAGTAFSARFVTLAGTRIRYIDAGTGASVVFLHGLAASLYTWRNTLQPIMQAGVRGIAFDNPGFGGAAKPPTRYRKPDYERLVIALLDSLHIQDAVLVGHSMGGAIAAEVAIRDPQRVRGLVLIGAAGLGAREPMLFKVARWPVLGPLMVSFRGRSLTERLLRSTYADPEKITPADVDQYYAAVAYPGYGTALRAVLREFDFNALDGRLERIQAATLLIWGAEDRWVPLGAGRAIAAQLLRAAFVIVPHAGHAVQEEAPAETNRFLIRFLTQGLPRLPENLAWVGPGPYISSTIWLRN